MLDDVISVTELLLEAERLTVSGACLLQCQHLIYTRAA